MGGGTTFDWREAATRSRVLRTDEVATIRSFVTAAEAGFRRTTLSIAAVATNLLWGLGHDFFGGNNLIESSPTAATGLASAATMLGVGHHQRPEVAVYGQEERLGRLRDTNRLVAVFPRQVPPELVALPTPAPDDAVPSVEALRARAAGSGLYLSLGGTLLIGGHEAMTGFHATGFELAPVEVVQKPPAAWYADLGYEVNPRLRFGANVLFAHRPRSVTWVGYSYGTTLTSYGEVVLKPHDPLFFDGSPWSLAVAAGPTISSLKTGIGYDFPPLVLVLDPTLEDETGHSTSEVACGIFGRLSASYYLSNSLAFVGALSYRTRPGVVHEGVERHYASGPQSANRAYRYDTFSSTFPSFDLFLGTRWHFGAR